MTNDVAPKPPAPKAYLGDGAYAQFDGYQIQLTAENGMTVSDCIYLEPAVLRSLFQYAKDCGIVT